MDEPSATFRRPRRGFPAKPPLDPATINPDKLLTPGQLAKMLPGTSEANHAHRATVHRWTSQGVKVKGEWIKLRVRITPGGQRLVRWGDFVEFRRQCDEARGLPAEPVERVEIETPAARKRRAAKSAEACRRLMAEIKAEYRVGGGKGKAKVTAQRKVG